MSARTTTFRRVPTTEPMPHTLIVAFDDDGTVTMDEHEMLNVLSALGYAPEEEA
ncbi:hypothetical protein [Rathayibacter sp. AY2B9]|uniref:hypothetical protein n=1 Tax=Rathayibacter sp. AY2B9 TaxID=2080572 RepID=UPI0015E3EFF1|nr:hypothetical protein [Rathayibacter sp. AY2B9]